MIETKYQNNHHYSRYFYVCGTIMLFGLTVLLLNKNGYIPPPKPPTAHELEIKEEPKRSKSTVRISEVDITGKLIYAKDGTLYALDPLTNVSDVLVSGITMEHPGLLSDGRLFFWQKDGEVYKRLFIQQEAFFEKFILPLEKNDGSFGIGTPPLLASNGKFVVFTSDRDAKDNYRRRALYHYDLDTFELKKLTDNKTMNIYAPFLSSDDTLIGFTYQNIEGNKGSQPTALGLMEVEAGVVNLFPKVVVSNLAIAFTQDNQYIVFTSQEGVSLFDLEKGKITQTIVGGVFQTLGLNRYIVVQQEITSKKPSYWQKCFAGDMNKQIIPPVSALTVYQLQDKDLKPVSSMELQHFSVYFPQLATNNVFSSDGEQFLVEFQDQDHCDGSKGILNLATNTITPLTEVGKNTAFWAGGK